MDKGRGRKNKDWQKSYRELTSKFKDDVLSEESDEEEEREMARLEREIGTLRLQRNFEIRQEMLNAQAAPESNTPFTGGRHVHGGGFPSLPNYEDFVTLTLLTPEQTRLRREEDKRTRAPRSSPLPREIRQHYVWDVKEMRRQKGECIPEFDQNEASKLPAVIAMDKKRDMAEELSRLKQERLEHTSRTQYQKRTGSAKSFLWNYIPFGRKKKKKTRGELTRVWFSITENLERFVESSTDELEPERPRFRRMKRNKNSKKKEEPKGLMKYNYL